MFYNTLRRLLFLIEPEFIHNTLTNIGEFSGRYSLLRNVISSIYNYKTPGTQTVVDGITYKSPVLLSAGFDYNGRLSQILPCVGFGGEEIGSITAFASKGNPKPRLRRLRRNKSILVNKGLKNEGVVAIINRLKKAKRIDNFILGISIAMTNRAESADRDTAIKDYCTTLKRLVDENIGDYYTLNISCPNAFCGENFVTPDRLKLLLTKIMEIDFTKPMYIKMPINKTEEEFSEMLKVIDGFARISGIIVGNLNKNYDDLKFRDEAPQDYAGGLSGMPTQELSNKWIKYTKDKYKDRFTIIGVGGIFSASDAMIKFDLGADLVQLITGLIYQGPSLIGQINKAYEQRMKNFKS